MMRFVWVATIVLLVGACSNGKEPSGVDNNNEVAEAIHGRGSVSVKWWDALPRKEWADYERVLPDTNWFEVYRVLPDVYAIYEPHQFEEVISFLVVGTSRALLFDTGLGVARMRPVVSALTDLDVLVVNSHSHYDHVGGNYEFDVIQSLDNDFSHSKTAGRSVDDVKEFVTGDWMAKPVPAGIDVSNYSIKPYTITPVLDDGSIIDLGDRQLQVVRTPGHTPDSLCLIDRKNRLLFTGDTFYLAPLYVHLDESSFDDFKTSVERLDALSPYVDLLLTAHNVPIAKGNYLRALKLAVRAIELDEVPFEETDGAREYDFVDYSIIVPHQN